MDIYPGPTPANLACLPQALTQRTQWVLWQGVDRLDTVTGLIKLNKIPVNAHGLTPADTTDARTWSTYQACVDALGVALEEWELADPGAYRGGGLGYVLADDDPYTGIDLDRCVDLATGAVAPWAQTYVDALASYTEITPSGTGLHILVEGSLPPKGRRKGQVEMYDQWRFFTMTGWHLPAHPADDNRVSGGTDGLLVSALCARRRAASLVARCAWRHHQCHRHPVGDYPRQRGPIRGTLRPLCRNAAPAGRGHSASARQPALQRVTASWLTLR